MRQTFLAMRPVLPLLLLAYLLMTNISHAFGNNNNSTLQPTNNTGAFNTSETSPPRNEASDEEFYCDSQIQITYPKTAETKDEQWVQVVQHRENMQGIRVELCVFLKHGNILKGFAICFAKENKGAEDFQQTVEFYKEFLDEYSLVFAELQMWKHYLDHDPTRSALTGALEALDNCPQENFPNIYTILKILATLPVSTSTAERTFSSLKRIKTIQRNTITAGRLNGLTALAVHRSIQITPDEVIDELAKKPRKHDILI